jgi:hypothetical protein
MYIKSYGDGHKQNKRWRNIWGSERHLLEVKGELNQKIFTVLGNTTDQCFSAIVRMYLLFNAKDLDLISVKVFLNTLCRYLVISTKEFEW